MSASSDRRTVLAGIALAPVAALPAMAATTAPDSGEWGRRLLEYRNACKISDAACAKRDAAEDAWRAASTPYPNVIVDGEPMTVDQFKKKWGTLLRALEDVPDKRKDRPGIAELRKGKAMHLRVEVANKRLYRKMGIPALCREEYAADERRDETWLSLCSYPATDIQELARKVDLIEQEGCDSQDYVDDIVADVRRIAETRNA
ncbi:hypothetical protein [Sphingosinicella soli]|uniref:Secreted protein n=1 Tax=Sphingosinicella soli TaxID=333708 RepID=A0A7W7F798_9SPHN|nr:hypothetical protein [Sphingosinicella soli]MBB4633201.1 hypothetical protein [Sphingosinicella soli]